MYKVMMVSMGGTRVETGIEGSFNECSQWCELMGWEACPDGGYVWDLEIDEV